MIKTVIKSALNDLGFELINKRKQATPPYLEDRKVFDLYEHAQKACQMETTDNEPRRQRHYTLNHLLWNTDLSKGDVCECGCWRGLSSYQIASHLKNINSKAVFHIFDSFEGLSVYDEKDKNEEVFDMEKRRKHFACSMNQVQENLKEFPFIKFYKGWIPERFNEVADREFSFVHVDVDLYQPISDCINFFYPRLVKGGMIVFDDYGCAQFPGAKKAVDECLARYDRSFFIPLPSGQAFVIKK